MGEQGNQTPAQRSSQSSRRGVLPYPKRTPHWPDVGAPGASIVAQRSVHQRPANQYSVCPAIALCPRTRSLCASLEGRCWVGTILCQHEQPQRGREIALLPFDIDLRDKIAKSDLPLVRN